MANSIFPAFSYEYNQRRELQNYAVGLCFDINQEFQYIIDALDLDINKFGESIELLDAEVDLLRVWRQSDNSKRKALEKKERENMLKRGSI